MATLNARREPATQGSHEKAGGNDNDEDGIGETTPPPTRGFCPSGYVFRPTERGDCQDFQEQVQPNELV